MFEKIEFDVNDVEKNKVIAALSNIPILFWLYLVSDKDSEYLKHHANHGLWFLIVGVVVGFISAILILIPIIGWLISSLLSLALLAMFVFGLYTAIDGKGYKWPVFDDVKIIK